MKMRLLYRTSLWFCLLATVLTIVLSTQAVGDGYIKGVVTRAGRPVRSVWVTVTQNGGEKGSSPTGDDGKYYIGGLDNGVYEITVTQGDQRLCQRRFRLPENNGIYNISLPCP
jgi:outer membrane usher protein FimD/PapC